MIILMGADGMLGSMLATQLTARSMAFTPCTYPEFDISRPESLRPLVSLHPTVIINASAYTAVDLAETEPEKAYSVNANGVKTLAMFAKEVGARLIHFSTDYVFSGQSSQGYVESDITEPTSVYGQSKLAGEQAIRETLPLSQWIILRTAWLYGPKGKNFVQTMLMLAGQGKALRVVNDQIGCPTYSGDLAKWTLDLLYTPASGIYHAVNAGTCSWYDFATTIFEQQQIDVSVTPVTSDAFPSVAKRPAYSILKTQRLSQALNYKIRKWPEALSEYLSSFTLRT